VSTTMGASSLKYPLPLTYISYVYAGFSMYF
jgi:hypothetical protein